MDETWRKNTHPPTVCNCENPDANIDDANIDEDKLNDEEDEERAIVLQRLMKIEREKQAQKEFEQRMKLSIAQERNPIRRRLRKKIGRKRR